MLYRARFNIHPDADALALAGAELFVQLALRSLTERGRFNVALSGGSTPRRMHQILAQPPVRNQINWAGVHVFWGDERFVPADNADSTLLMAQQSLLNHVPIPRGNIHAMPTMGVTPEEAARDYAATLKAHFGAETPRFDLIFLGMGPDGHTASLFPGQAEVYQPSGALVAVVKEAPKPPPLRLTLTYRLLNAAKNVILLVAGSDKSETVRRVFGDEINPQVLPVQGIQPVQGDLLWLLDEAAASGLQPLEI